MTKPWRRHGRCSYCLDGRLHTHRGRLEWFLSDLRSYFQPQTRILEWLANHPDSEVEFPDLVRSTGLTPAAANRGLRKLTKQGLVLARIVPGHYPNKMRYQLSPQGKRCYATTLPLPVFDFPGPYDLDAILDEELGKSKEK